MTPDTLLERLDLALADAPEADADLLALVGDVRTQAPRMTTEFAATLDERVRAGFAREPRAPRLASGLRHLRAPKLFVLGPLGAAAAAVVVLVVSSSGGGGSTSPSPSVLAQREATATTDTAASKSGASGGVAGVPTPSSTVHFGPNSLTTASPGRRVERTTQLALSTTTDHVQAVADGVVSATQQAGGFVSNSQVQIDGRHGSATFTLRIPSARLEPALTALTRLAHVTSMSQSTQDITGEFATTNTRLARLHAQLGALRRRPQTPATLARERAVRRAIAAQQGALSALRHRADYVTVELTVTGHPRAHHAAVRHGGGFTPGNALHDAGRILEVGLGVLVIAAAILIPLGLLLAGAGLAARSLRRRNREAALKTS